MRIAVVGTGKMGRGFASALSPRHEVVFGSRDPSGAGGAVRATGAAGALAPAEAAAGAKVLVLAVPWRAVEETAARLGGSTGTVVIDVTVPYGKDVDALGRRSSGEVVQRLLKGSRVVKGWNHVFAKTLADPVVDGVAPSVLVAGDDPGPSGSSRPSPGRWGSIRSTWARSGRAPTSTGS